MLLCAENGLFSSTFEGDAKPVTEEVNAKEDSQAPHRQLIEKVKKLCKCDSNQTISFVPRKGNKAAHSLIKHAMTDTREAAWIEDIPSCIFNYVLNDKLCMDCQFID